VVTASPPVPWRHLPFLEQHTSRGENRLISALYDFVLLWGVRSREVALYTFIGAEISELLADELPIVVSAQNTQRSPDFDFCRHLDRLD
jgi:hypothetical protein